MRFKENRKLAFAVLIVVILFSIVVQGSVALLNRRGDTEVVFMEGEMHQLMSRCAEQSALLGQMAEMYLSEGVIGQYGSAETTAMLTGGGYTALPAELAALSAELKNAPDPNTCMAVLAEMHAAVEKTYTALDMLDIADADFRNIKLAYYDFVGAIDIVSRDGDDPRSYTAQASVFNDEISHFPASLFCTVLSVEPLTVYGG